ncbi:MAG: hypothetical protein NTW32_17730 [Chloroflexi bacterium]|nr:hypothetical protein [Chloroflexota bacterium]
MEPSNVEENEEDLVRCTLCQNHVWVRKDRLEKHIGKIHSKTAAPKKSFTTYHAHLASTFPPRVKTQAITKPVSLPAGAKSDITLISRAGSRVGPGRCAECGLDHKALWRYAESSQGLVDICSQCKPKIFERSFEKADPG